MGVLLSLLIEVYFFSYLKILENYNLFYFGWQLYQLFYYRRIDLCVVVKNIMNQLL